jgi:hypothetical protein
MPAVVSAQASLAPITIVTYCAFMSTACATWVARSRACAPGRAKLRALFLIRGFLARMRA